MKEATLIRRSGNTKQTLGYLFADGFDCDTLELGDLNNQKDISCIPCGEYICKWTLSHRLGIYTYEVTNVPFRTGIRIHAANRYDQLKGCIAPGNGFADINGDGQLDVLNSRRTLARFEDLMGGEDFKLTIKNSETYIDNRAVA
jgi:hypothetical protein